MDVKKTQTYFCYVGVLCFFLCFAWTDDANAQFTGTLHQSSNVMSLGVMHQPLSCLDTSFATLIMALPAMAIGLIPLIGNAAVFHSRSFAARRVWGTIGIISGVLGLAVTTFTTVIGVSSPCGARSFDPVVHLLNPLGFAVHLTSIILGILNHVRVSQEEAALNKRVTFTPWFGPTRTGGTTAGLLVRGSF